MFQNSVLKTFKDDEKLVAQRWAFYQNYKSKVEAIKEFKEEEYQDGFLKDIFENCLGYTLKTTNPSSFNLEREKKNETDSKKADAVIYINDEIMGVIELKAQDTKNLDKVQQQAFYYLSQHSKSKYVIISNFDELRFYIEKSTSYESFSLFNLSYEEFSKLHLILAYENIKDEKALKIREKSNLFEQNISKNLYKDFSNFRTLLFDNLVKNNLENETLVSSDSNLLPDKSQLLRLTQKLCDRIIFILFAEDRALLRTNMIKEIRDEFINQKFTNYSLYDIYKFYFDAINKGNERLDIPQYNGGLFAVDELLDSLIIDDFILDENVQILSNYDFASEISVNILGHIFEQSLTDLEELQANIENIDFDKTKSKRKKDGVFYTPEYITRYIVENTLGKMCSEKREELQIGNGILTPSNPKKLTKQEQQTKDNLQEYKNWLLNLKILDPACGSGAFLNQALEYLISEHKNLQNDLALMGDLFASYMVEEEILEHNLYGVDINEDAVEIAKLSLWLRTAKRGRPLTKLADKIVCANSLLEMPFSENSFDVVIGNPPYVRQEAIKEQKEALSKIYKVANGTADLYVYFYEASLKVLKNNGILGFITPNKFYKTNYAQELRKLLQSNKINILIDFFELKIFEDASTDSQIIILEKSYSKNNTFHYCPIKNIEEFKSVQYEQINIMQDNLKSEIWVFNNKKEELILNKMFKKYITLKEYTNNGIEYGIKTGFNRAFIIDKYTKEKIIKEDQKSEELIKPYVSGTDIKRYVLLNSEQLYFINTYFDLDICQYKGIYNWLMTFNDELLKREDKGKHHFNLRACKYYEKFNLPKIIYIHTAVEHSFYYDENGYYINNSCYLISNADKFLSAFLNSKMFKFYKKLNFVAYGNSSGSGRAKLDYNKMVNVPIPLIEDKTKGDFIYKVDILREISKKLQELKQNFINELNLEKIPTKLQKFEELDFDDFVKEYAKAKKLKFADKLEERNFKNDWQRLFENDKKEVLEIQNQINITDKEIDQMVYKLYDLTSDEIKIVEN
ncbi:Eco57I restriction-modification methylase domain-containing protein [Arcobacter porcinus]|uniref:Eco57I restriction-modification methylase domain-containing protein n=1 Tax=Arcobacter porcinus TaxID=1935204 RepID=UPI00081DAB40|nr:N-6 DNA methylase [Arcobacter porcinus]OCL82070.1 Type IIS restriction enzyme Eco57I [Arcobacter porcinus]